jgi:hypothetical protein
MSAKVSVLRFTAFAGACSVRNVGTTKLTLKSVELGASEFADDGLGAFILCVEMKNEGSSSSGCQSFF